MYSQSNNQTSKLPEILRLLNEPEQPEEIVDRKAEIDQPKLYIQIDDFDPAIKIGRDNKLFLKRKYIERLRKETRYTEEELVNLKDIYVSSAEIGKGLNLERFREFLGHIYNVENHVLLKRLFTYFDKNEDGIVEYLEAARSLDIIEKGNFIEKVEFCYSIYDADGLGYLDSYGIRELMKLSYTNVITRLEQCVIKVQKTAFQNSGGLSWNEFSDPRNEIVKTMTDCVPVVLDRYDYKRAMIEILEKEYKFNITKLEKFWKIYKAGLQGESESNARNYYAGYLNIPGSQYLTTNQFKLIMHDVFKIDDPLLLEAIYSSIDQSKKGCLEASGIVSEMLFFLRGSFEHKMLLFFEVNSSKNTNSFVLPKSALSGFLERLIKFYQGLLDSAREIADHMKTSKGGKIYYEDFLHFCQQFPSAMDFITRITIGEHPLPEKPEEAPVQSNQSSFQSLQDGQVSMDYVPDIDTNDLYQKNKLPSKRWLPRNIKNGF